MGLDFSPMVAIVILVLLKQLINSGLS
jgi:uncharacterized protein YggT (Ycf19 family)